MNRRIGNVRYGGVSPLILCLLRAFGIDDLFSWDINTKQIPWKKKRLITVSKNSSSCLNVIICWRALYKKTNVSLPVHLHHYLQRRACSLHKYGRSPIFPMYTWVRPQVDSLYFFFSVVVHRPRVRRKERLLHVWTDSCKGEKGEEIGLVFLLLNATPA